MYQKKLFLLIVFFFAGISVSRADLSPELWIDNNTASTITVSLTSVSNVYDENLTQRSAHSTSCLARNDDQHAGFNFITIGIQGELNSYYYARYRVEVLGTVTFYLNYLDADFGQTDVNYNGFSGGDADLMLVVNSPTDIYIRNHRGVYNTHYISGGETITIWDMKQKPWPPNYFHQFVLPTRTLNIVSYSHGTTVPAPGTYTYSYGTVVTVTAYPDYHYMFTGWGYNSTVYPCHDNPIQITMNQNHNLYASFAYDKNPSLSKPPEENDSANEVIKDYQLEQNYPNPFNPETRIKYNLPKSERAIVKIYNLNGKELETLVDAVQTAGEHEVTWRPQDLPSGIYFYRLQAGDFSKTKKLIFQK